MIWREGDGVQAVYHFITPEGGDYMELTDIVISSNVNDSINNKHRETKVLRAIYFTNIQ